MLQQYGLWIALACAVVAILYGAFSVSWVLARSPGNEREWLDACKGGKVKPGGNFEFSGMVTETLLLGNVATRSGQKLAWDREKMSVTNLDAAQKLVQPDRRSGWDL
jgi:hypothetical protein